MPISLDRLLAASPYLRELDGRHARLARGRACRPRTRRWPPSLRQSPRPALRLPADEAAIGALRCGRPRGASRCLPPRPRPAICGRRSRRPPRSPISPIRRSMPGWPCCCGAAVEKGDFARPADAGQFGPGAVRPRQAWRARAQLFLRHRHRRVLRPRRRRARRSRRGHQDLLAHRPAAGRADGGSDRQRLCFPHRSAPSPRSGIDAGGALDRCGDGLLREPRPELGACRLDQGAAVRRRQGGGGGVRRRTRPLHLAPPPRLRDHRRHPGDEAADQRQQECRRCARRGAQRQARSRRYPRDRVLRPDAAADCGWPRQEPARPADRDGSGGAGPHRLDRRKDCGGPHADLLVPAGGREPPADAARRADPHHARDRRGRGGDRPADGLPGHGSVRDRVPGGAGAGAGLLRRAVHRGRDARRGRRRRSGVHRQRRRSGDARDAEQNGIPRCRDGIGDDPQMALWQLSGDAGGRSAGASDRAAAGAAHHHRAAPAMPTLRSSASTISCRGCRPASSFSPCCAPTPTCATCCSS